ncbi:PREDICTED: uncharacterized protein LOC109125962 [Camelina sativa]|uniref:Uncharacterized protein LOC109125962 n=1 Tax=Camelina sativa TaxID=90675 RepID=A0ABM1QC41_CAMSA|nr:PREDICTED: uncharacterized protein LOC109125962 [Camelina sativa]
MLENLFRDNKEARAIQLENELRNLTIGDLVVHDYCQKLKSISDTLANVDSLITDRALVMHLLNGLSSKFDNIINVIKHRSPPCSFGEARSMLINEEDRLKTKRQTLPNNDDNASSPQVLLVSSQQQYDQPRSTPSNQQFQYSRGGGRNNRSNRGGGRGNKGRGGNPNYNSGTWGSGNQSWTWPNQPQWSTPPQWPIYPQWPTFPQWPNSPQPPSPFGPSPPQARFHAGPTPPQPTQGILGHAPSPTGSAYLTTTHPTAASPSNTDLIPTTLAHAFNTMTFPDPNDAGWYMDTGATAHLTSQPGSSFPSASHPM